MSKIKKIYPHELLIKEEKIDVTELSTEAQTAIDEFKELKAAGLEDEANEVELSDKVVAKLDMYSKSIVTEIDDYLAEQEEAATTAAKAKADEEAATATAAKAKADEEAATATAAKAKADEEAAAKAKADEAAKKPKYAVSSALGF